VRPVPLSLATGIAAVISVGIWSGCAAHQNSAPADVVRAFGDSIVQKDWDRGYRLMSDEYRRRVPLARFRAEMEVEARIVGTDAAVLAKQSFDATRAIVQTPGGESFKLVLNGDAWKLSGQPLAPFAQDSPRAALRTLLRAIEGKRYDVMLRLIPAEHRSRVNEDRLRLYWEGDPSSGARRRLLEILRANLDMPIVELEHEAYMPYGAPGPPAPNPENQAEGEVRFLLEDGVWKIDDIE
jgi:hypothetical protein